MKTHPLRSKTILAFVTVWALLLLAPAAFSDTVALGTLSFDTFIPAGSGSPGVDAFDVANLTGAFNLPPDFPVSDSLTFESAVLTLTLSDSTQEVFDLGDIGPGFLLDGSGNPVVQVPGDQSFVSAELTATLAPATFTLFDGSSFVADSSTLDVLLLPSLGSALTADVDQTVITVSGSPATTAVPEPSGELPVSATAGLLCWFLRQRWLHAKNQARS